MFAGIKRRSLYVYHLQMGGWNGDALEWEALFSPRFLPRLRKLGVSAVPSVEEADVVVATGLLTHANLDAVLAEIALMPQTCTLIAAGDAAINGGIWAREQLPGISPYPLSHYADISIIVPGNPPTPQSLLAALAAAASPRRATGVGRQMVEEDEPDSRFNSEQAQEAPLNLKD